MDIKQAFLENKILMEQAGAVIHAVRTQNYYEMAQLQKKMVRGMQAIITNKSLYESYFQGEFIETTLLSILKGLLEAQEQCDLVLYADLVQLEFIPFLQALQASVYEKEGILLEEENVKASREFLSQFAFCDALHKIPDPPEEEYHVVPAATGAVITQIRNQKKHFYLHSNVDPVEEAEELVDQYYDCTCEQFYVFGLGNGYHIAALNRRCDQSARIDVYESDLNILKLAYKYGLPKEMMSENVHIYHDLYCKEIAAACSRDQVDAKGQNMPKLMIHYPSIQNIRNSRLEEIFDKFFVKESSMRNNYNRMFINYRENLLHYQHYADELQKEFQGKDVYLVAAGPSLDQTMDKLRYIDRSKSVILSVGTVFKKLITAGIRPDYVTFLDPGERTYGHIDGLEEEQIPILIASTAYRKIAKQYKGPVYLVCQEGYEPAEQYALEHGYRQYRSGGSVSTIALDIAIRLKANRIICMGLDLAYPNHISHAEGTMDRQISDMSNYYQVKSFDGGMVETSNLFLIYREWIERRIEKETGCTFYNTSVGGAYIEGMKHCRIEEIV